MNDHITGGSFLLSAQRTGDRGYGLRLFVVVTLLVGLAGTTSAWAKKGGNQNDSGFQITTAQWDKNSNTLTVNGDNAPNGGDVTIKYGKINDNGAEIETVTAGNDGSWSFEISEPNPVPCNVTAQTDGRDPDDKSVRRAPRNCSDDGGDPPVNIPPTANANGPYAGTTGAAISFSSAGSNDPDGSITAYSWTFGDGDTSTAANPSHTYAAVGTYNVSLTVTDDGGTTASDSTTATISDAVACNPADLDTSINSTSQDGCPDQILPEVGQVLSTAPSTDYSVLAINDLGMHCGDLDTRIASILPPFQAMLAQVIQKGGTPTLNPAGVDLHYSAVSNPNDPLLDPTNPLNRIDVFDGVNADGTTYKTNFWNTVAAGTYDPFYPAFNPFDPAQTLTPLVIDSDVGLPVPNVEHFYLGADGVPGTGDEHLSIVLHAMPGIADPYTANDRQLTQEHYTDKPFFMNFPFGYVAEGVNWYEGAGIPFAAFDDNGRENAYPLVRVEARQGNTTVSTVDTVLPISGEANCTNCHAQPDDLLSITEKTSRSTAPTTALSAAGLPVALSIDDPDNNLPPRVSLEYAADINTLRLHDLKHGENYVTPSAADDGTTVADSCVMPDTDPDNPNPENGSASCLTNKALVQNEPVVCQVCHYTPALDLAQLGPLTGPEGSIANGRNHGSHKSNSNVMHSHHGSLGVFTEIPPPVQLADGTITNHTERLTALEESCYQCHPGTNTQCLRGAMFNGGMLCNDCHGDMAQVGNDFSANVSPTNPGAFELGGNFYDPNDPQPRVPWANEPGCGSCHTGDVNTHIAGDADTMANTADVDGNTDNIRLRVAYRVNPDGTAADAKATPIVPTDKRFAEPEVPATTAKGVVNNGAGNPQLYRVSTGHGGVMCEGCHGATHAEWPNGNPDANDNVAANQLQGHTGPIIECDTCHTNVDNLTPNGKLSSLEKGPHGMHAVGDTQFARGKHKEGMSRDACRACHGQNGEGTVLSRMATDRVLECKEGTDFCPDYDDGKDPTALFPKGHAVGCTECHDNKL